MKTTHREQCLEDRQVTPIDVLLVAHNMSPQTSVASSSRGTHNSLIVEMRPARSGRIVVTRLTRDAG